VAGINGDGLVPTSYIEEHINHRFGPGTDGSDSDDDGVPPPLPTSALPDDDDLEEEAAYIAVEPNGPYPFVVCDNVFVFGGCTYGSPTSGGL